MYTFRASLAGFSTGAGFDTDLDRLTDVAVWAVLKLIARLIAPTRKHARAFLMAASYARLFSASNSGALLAGGSAEAHSRLEGRAGLQGRPRRVLRPQGKPHGYD